MRNFSELASSRRSIRKYEDKDIPLGEIEEFIKTAVYAPSGCNSQCWKFVAIKDRSVLNKIENAVICKMNEFLAASRIHLSEQYTASKEKMVSFFSKAPVVIAVFMTDLTYYDPTFNDALKAQGYDDEGIMKLLAYPDILSIGAAVQNLLLAVHEKGYGACWMNEPAIAGEEIRKILNVPEGCKFISLIPVGIPAYTPRDKKLKDLNEIFTAI
ncbi:MAG: nitroreductase family protein [Clostridia bacterium]|nr:nitroreductase family protein [Clostridia bacterium]